jgi:hypothetical protein
MKRNKRNPRTEAGVGSHRAQHLDLATRVIAEGDAIAHVLVDESESPLAWLARRKGRDGRPMIASEEFIAGEKLRADFTRAQMSPRITSNWSAPTGRAAPGSGAGEMTDAIVAARQRVRLAMQACGPEFSGLLLDVCCFLRGLEDIERERNWPQRSGKIVLQLGLARLARHYGLLGEAEGQGSGIRAWTAE